MLTDKAVRAAVAKEKPYKISDGNSPSLHISKKGRKTWRFKFRFGHKEQLLILGAYPDIFLANARERRNEARKLSRHRALLGRGSA